VVQRWATGLVVAYNGSASDLMVQHVERICDFIHNAYSLDVDLCSTIQLKLLPTGNR
jgi:hypothetical protein